MVGGLFHPLNIFILGLGGGFLIPLLYRFGKTWPAVAFVSALAAMAAISATSLAALLQGAPAIEVLTAGSLPPVSINFRFGLWEGVFTLCVNLVALLSAWHLWERLRDSYAAMLIVLILVVGINGMVMTRDLFNLFVFLEITSIATYGLFSLKRTPEALSASFKYIMATVLASAFLLLGAALLYFVTGTLNIDDMIVQRALIVGPIGGAGLVLVLACLLLELKPFPANGWGLDVYETAPSGVAALVSVAVSAGVFFALFKTLPMFEDQLDLIALSGGLTFLFSNLIGLRQTKVRRLLGYSSVGQMGLLVLALAVLQDIGAQSALPIVIGGLFVNHFFAKAGLFWLAGIVDREHIDGWAGLRRRPDLLLVLALLLAAISGFPPFPGFWGKWEFVMRLAGDGRHVWIVVVLAGSLLEAAYMFNWFGRALRPGSDSGPAAVPAVKLVPVHASVALSIVAGLVVAHLAGALSAWLLAPLGAGILLYLVDGRLPGRVKCALALVLVLVGGVWLTRDLDGLNHLFSVLLVAGSLVIASAGLYRADPRPGYHALLAAMLLSIPALFRSSTSLEFFYSWEIVTLTSYFLIAYGRDSGPHLLRYLLFSLVSAFFVLSGFAFANAANGTSSLASLATSGPPAGTAFVLLGIGFLIKAAAFGVHVWLPGAYSEADDDFSALLSAVVSKLAMFGLLIGTYLTIRSPLDLGLSHALAWIGLITTTAGAFMALGENDLKRMLAYSSMSQIGYIVTAIALMSHLGWVTALYLVANHLLVKGILFLAAAGVILRTGTRRLDGAGGLFRSMPLTFAAVVFAVVAMSGLPPLMGFGGKWLLVSAMTDKGWYWLVALSLLATFFGFFYMARLVHAVFLGARRPEHGSVREAPPALLVPQFVLVAAIVVLSFFPKLLMEPVSAAIDPYFASTLVWEGMSLETIYGYWNPVPIMSVATAVALAMFLGLWIAYRRGWSGAGARRGAGSGGFDAFHARLARDFAPPVATRFWDGVSSAASSAAQGARKLYTGDGQTYALYILYYFIGLYLLDRIGNAL